MNTPEQNVIDEVSIGGGAIVYRAFETASGGKPSYGISVDSCAFGNQSSASVADITPEKEGIIRLLYLLADNSVLPSALRETIEDIITEKPL